MMKTRKSKRFKVGDYVTWTKEAGELFKNRGGDIQYGEPYRVIGLEGNNSDGKQLIVVAGGIFCSYWWERYKGEVNMTKQGLKDLDRNVVVELRNGKLFLLVKIHSDYILINQKDSPPINLDIYNRDLSRAYNPDFDIIRIYEGNFKFGIDMIFCTSALIYERVEEPTELTIKEIAEKFGLDPSKVRIKE